MGSDAWGGSKNDVWASQDGAVGWEWVWDAQWCGGARGAEAVVGSPAPTAVRFDVMRPVVDDHLTACDAAASLVWEAILLKLYRCPGQRASADHTKNRGWEGLTGRRM